MGPNGGSVAMDSEDSTRGLSSSLPPATAPSQLSTVFYVLSLPPPGIEPGSPASQAGTLPKELSRELIL